VTAELPVDELPELDRRAMSRLLALGQRVVSELDPAAVLPLVAAYAREVVDADLLLVPMVSPDRRSYRYAAGDGDGAELAVGQDFPAETGACGWVMEHRRPLLFGLGARFELSPAVAWEPGAPSSLVVPLVARGRVTGGLAALGKRGGGAFDQRDQAVLTVFANLAAVAVDNARLFEELGAAQRVAEDNARENATLLREIHHRVKNNLQIVSSLLTLHDPALLAPEGRALLEDCAVRIRAMALIHEQLYGGSTLARVDLARYAQELVAGL
jgi:GAF domain-containing protein